MSGSHAVRLVAAREIRERLRSKAFRTSTLITLALILAAAILPGIAFNDEATSYDVGVVGEVPPGFAAALDEAAAAFGDSVVDVRELDDAAAAETLVTDGELDAAVVDTTSILVDEEIDPELGAIIQTAHRQLAGAAAIEGTGLSGAEAAAALNPEPLDVDALDPPSDESNQREGVSFFGTVLLFGQIFGFGFWVASGVVEEKSSRVMEVLLAKLTPTQLLTGKVLGIGLLAFAQLLVFIGIGLGAATASGTIDLPAEIIPTALVVLAWFVLGFAFYACLFAMGGALASRTEELQSTIGPITFIAMISYFGAVYANGSPDSVLARVISVLPPSAPLAMPVRIATGDAALWEIGLAIVLLLGAVALLLPLTARVHAGAALFTRGQLKLGQALRRAE